MNRSDGWSAQCRSSTASSSGASLRDAAVSQYRPCTTENESSSTCRPGMAERGTGPAASAPRRPPAIAAGAHLRLEQLPHHAPRVATLELGGVRPAPDSHAPAAPARMPARAGWSCRSRRPPPPAAPTRSPRCRLDRPVITASSSALSSSVPAGAAAAPMRANRTDQRQLHQQSQSNSCGAHRDAHRRSPGRRSAGQALAAGRAPDHQRRRRAGRRRVAWTAMNPSHGLQDAGPVACVWRILGSCRRGHGPYRRIGDWRARRRAAGADLFRLQPSGAHRGPRAGRPDPVGPVVLPRRPGARHRATPRARGHLQPPVLGLPYGNGYYSYVDAATAAGYATFDIDRIGAGNSSHPPSAASTLTAGAVALHDAVTALRSGAVDGHAFRHVIAVGHSIGSVEPGSRPPAITTWTP